LEVQARHSFPAGFHQPSLVRKKHAEVGAVSFEAGAGSDLGNLAEVSEQVLFGNPAADGDLQAIGSLDEI
jgi:hypothetical protein